MTRTVVPLSRSQRPTTPIVDRKPQPRETRREAMVPLEDRPTPIADPALALRVRNALIPLEDRPTPFAQATPAFALPLAPPERPTPPDRPVRVQTGPQLPIELHEAPTEIKSSLVEREDPTDVTGEQVTLDRPRTGTAQIVWPAKKPDHAAMHTWLMLCGLFVLAVAVAIVVALI